MVNDLVPNKSYRAIVVGVSDTTDGKYKVFIPSLSPGDETFTPYEAKNRVTPYGKWKNPDTNEVYSIGTYFPLQVGMQVEVMFETSSTLSGRITNFWYDEIPLDKEDQESFYLSLKTKKGSTIFSDDKRDITQIIHNNGRTTALLMNDKISLSVNEISDISNNNLTNVEISQDSIILKVGKNIVKLDDSGFHINVGDNIFEVAPNDFTFKSKNFAFHADEKLEFKANHVYITGDEQVDIKSTVTRVTGNQHVSLTSNVINIDSNLHTSVKSNSTVNIDALMQCSIDSTQIYIDALGVLYTNAPLAVYNGITTVLNGTTTAINGSTLFEDAMIIRGTGAGTSMATTSYSSAMAMKYAMQAADIGLVTAFHFNDPFSGMAANVMGESIPGVAQGVPNQLPIVNMAPSMDYINSTLKYIRKGNKVGDIGTVDYINSLSGVNFKKVFTPTSEE